MGGPYLRHTEGLTIRLQVRYIQLSAYRPTPPTQSLHTDSMQQRPVAAAVDPAALAALVLGHEIGAGSFGTVYDATLHGLPVAVKCVVKDSRVDSREAELCQELATASHSSIVKFLGVRRLDRPGGVQMLMVVMERVSHSLQDILYVLATHEQRMTRPKVCLFFPQLAAGLDFLHSNGIVHRDIRPGNILVCLRRQEVKIADFSSAKRLSAGIPSVTYISSRWYRAPELILDRDLYTVAVDMWSFGCVLAETARGCALFQAGNNSAQLAEIIKVIGSLTPHDVAAMACTDDWIAPEILPQAGRPWHEVLRIRLMNGQVSCTSYGAEFEALLSSLLCWRPAARLSAAQARQHPFFTQSN